MTTADIEAWAETRALDVATHPLGFDRLGPIPRVVFLGETNHFVHQKVDFRLFWLSWLGAHRRLVLAEELGWSDGRRVASYLFENDEAALDRVATFGYRGHQRDDRDDSPQGVFSQSDYPSDLMKAEHARFYRALRERPGLADSIFNFVGMDIDSPGGGYEDLSVSAPELMGRMNRVPGENRLEEAARLEALLPDLGESNAPGPEDLLCLIESLRYTDLVQQAVDYEAVRPAMSYRESCMKRRISLLLRDLPDDCTLVLMGHAFHLARDDAGIEQQGVGPGGDLESSLGHHIVHELDEKPMAMWMLYGAGTDSQPLSDLPRKADYPARSINRILANRIMRTCVLPITDDVAPHLASVSVGHLYNLCVRVDLPRQADAVMFFPEVTPLMAD